MAKVRMPADGLRRYHMALTLCGDDKRKIDVAVEAALSTMNGLTPYESAFEEAYIKLHLRKMVLSRLSWEEDMRRRGIPETSFKTMGCAA